MYKIFEKSQIVELENIAKDSFSGTLGITHNGAFHADECMSTAILHILFDDFHILRTRNFTEKLVSYRAVGTNDEKSFIEKCMHHINQGIMYDVGFKYDPIMKKFDHHQPDGPEREDGIPYSSAGLIWKHFGLDVIKKMVVDLEHTVSDAEAEMIFKLIDKEVIVHIDTADNGIGNPLSLSFSKFIGIQNENIYMRDDPNICFTEAVNMCVNLLTRMYCQGKSMVASIKEIKEKIGENKKMEYLILDFGNNWQDAIDMLELNNIKYVIYGSDKLSWKIQCVAKKNGTYENRKPFPEHWGGLTQKELQKVTGVQTALFCHKKLFLVSTKTLSDAIKIANLALKS